MPQINIQAGDNLSTLAQKYGTSVAALMQANQGNSAVKNPNLIMAGGKLNVPDAVGAPAAGPAPAAETPGGSLQVAPAQSQGAQNVGDLSNLRLTLRSALSEAAQQTAKNRMQQLSSLTGSGAAPNVIQAAIGLAQSGLRTSKEAVFNDIMAGYKDASDKKQQELDRINQLRLTFGSAVPSNVTDLKTALDLVAPLIDSERSLEKKTKMAALAKSLAEGQSQTDDIETAADFVAKGGSLAQIGGTAAYKAKVRVRAEALKKTYEIQAEQEYKDHIALRLENKTTDFQTEKTLVLQDNKLTTAEQRKVIDYIDGLEQTEINRKKYGGKIKPPASLTNPDYSNQKDPYGIFRPGAKPTYLNQGPLP